MPLYPGIPYGAAPVYCFPLTEICMYILFVLCLRHALKQGFMHVSYLLGGLLFGLLLEYVNVNSNMGYVYGRFIIMFGKAPQDIPLCIGVGWAIIMYAARLFTGCFNTGFWASIALDTLFAINIDLAMDTVAYRLHMWHWNWEGTGLNPLTADWFGIPYGNFFGWLMVVFFYSLFFRIFEKMWVQKTVFVKALIPLIAVVLSQGALYVMLVYVDAYLHERVGITALHRFVTFMLALLAIVFFSFSKRELKMHHALPLVSWLVPAWFHLYFFAWLFIGGFYSENYLLVVVSCINLFTGMSIHLTAMLARYNRPPAFELTAAE